MSEGGTLIFTTTLTPNAVPFHDRLRYLFHVLLSSACSVLYPAGQITFYWTLEMRRRSPYRLFPPNPKSNAPLPHPPPTCPTPPHALFSQCFLSHDDCWPVNGWKSLQRWLCISTSFCCLKPHICFCVLPKSFGSVAHQLWYATSGDSTHGPT
ncbi:hypothetical protein B0J14DRAFT_264209 [Halenospora varia]|nr:hypothetical protein B0J14DRAFT_264209 [Halenospora varia]